MGNYCWTLMGREKKESLHYFEDGNRETGTIAQEKWYHSLIYFGGFAVFCSWYVRTFIEFHCIIK